MAVVSWILAESPSVGRPRNTGFSFVFLQGKVAVACPDISKSTLQHWELKRLRRGICDTLAQLKQEPGAFPSKNLKFLQWTFFWARLYPQLL